MYLAIASDGVTLEEPERLNDLYASYWERLGPDLLGRILAEHADAELLPDGAHIMVPVATLRRLADGRVPEGWDADFEKMLAYAREKGWLSEDGTAVRAHLERER
ncbi:hypothetical protein [Actinomycetospora sp. TBRC 11914]|uniref:hypothetical protein n=1 Tax=Actinomycetospora sp. TBRC 11914 TaxID=2729387 RepID=UPI00145ECD9E|nr:hypothetical protein [Actinomycetospora sp. TBRC 11914]NMO94150.1 hypothetical protein [Actinomycetospora sp. TBRC 11914]